MLALECKATVSHSGKVLRGPIFTDEQALPFRGLTFVDMCTHAHCTIKLSLFHRFNFCSISIVGETPRIRPLKNSPIIDMVYTIVLLVNLDELGPMLELSATGDSIMLNKKVYEVYIDTACMGEF